MEEIPKDNGHEEAIFHAALELESPQARADYLAQACDQDLELLDRMKALLELNEIEDGFLENPPTLLDIPPIDQFPTESPGTHIGRCRLLDKIGEGGMATVYLAEQEEPVRRPVALKIIKPGMDSKQVITRFEAERQALALMNHQNIARVFDGGTTENGRPYFVMELVQGTSITVYCDRHSLDIEARLRLFIQVCHAVQHAHQQGIIHRDLKPSNVLVAEENGRAVPKIIDFGIAKALQYRLTEQTLCTEHGQLIGTPTYMSPEQAGLGQYDADARTDVYSLGVLLYELLTGTTPFSSQQFRDLSYDEICRTIREQDPVKPSTRLTQIFTESDSGSKLATRHSPLAADLDWIVMKALEKTKDRRYESMHDLALDVEHHLRDEPVTASPPSTVYRMGKFVRRHRNGTVTFLLVAAALVMGGVVSRLSFLFSPGSTGKDAHAPGMVMRHVWDLPGWSSATGTISPDGRYLSYVDWTAGNLVLHDLVNDTGRQLTQNRDWEHTGTWNEWSVISPDGREVAYSWVNANDPRTAELRVVDIQGEHIQTLYKNPETFWIKPLDWSPDGQAVLAYISDVDKADDMQVSGQAIRRGHFILVSLQDKTVKRIKTWDEPAAPSRADISPDGRYIAYQCTKADQPTKNDLFIMELASGHEQILIEHPADDRLWGWTPDGRRILFTSTRTAKKGLWIQDVLAGVPQGPPRLIKDDISNTGPVGFTADGAYYYSLATSASNVYLATLDQTGVQFEAEPRFASDQRVGTATMGNWSPDGTKLAFRTDAQARRVEAFSPANWLVVVLSAETGDEHILNPSLPFKAATRMRGPWWAPDGQSLLVSATTLEKGSGLYSLDIESGTCTLLFPKETRTLKHADWSPDMDTIYFTTAASIMRWDAATGQERKLYTGPRSIATFDLSPDGRWLAFYTAPDQLAVLPTTGGDARVVHTLDRVPGATTIAFVSWTPDSKHLLCSGPGDGLYEVNIETGQVRPIGSPRKNLIHVDMHPDGRQVTFTAQEAGTELWVIEGFLPE